MTCQSDDGPGALLVYRQGEKRALRQQASDNPYMGAELDRFTLPPRFRLSCWCPQDHRSAFIGEAEDGLWIRTLPAD